MPAAKRTPSKKKIPQPISKDKKPPRQFFTDKQLDTAGLVALFGGRSRLLYLMRDYGYISADPTDPMPDVFARTLTLKAIDKWKERGVIPSHWLQVLMEMHQAEFGSPLPIETYRLKALSVAVVRGIRTGAKRNLPRKPKITVDTVLPPE